MSTLAPYVVAPPACIHAAPGNDPDAIYSLAFAIFGTPSVHSKEDIDGNGVVNGADLGLLLGAWGSTGGSGAAADINGDGVVDGADLGMLLGAWGG